MHELLEIFPYKDVSIRIICEAVPISRPTFYYHFASKDALIEWMIQQDFLDNAVPLFKHHLKETGVRSFFDYIQQNKPFYRRIYEHDSGALLFRSLISAYNSGVDIASSYSRPPSYSLPKINHEVYRRYANTGIAAVITYWIENEMTIPVEKMASDLYLMIENPLKIVRDNSLNA
jgi:AcrR family transcriptional regulator